MTEIFGVPTQALFGQLLLGLINGAFYAMLSLGLAIIFGLLNIINFAHGALYMMGAFCAWMLLTRHGLGYWAALVLAPVIVGVFGVIIERTLLTRLYKLDHLYGLLLTFGLALDHRGPVPHRLRLVRPAVRDPGPSCRARINLGFMFLPNYRAWVVVASLVVCLATWFVIERTKLGAYLRAATENPPLVQAFGVNVPRMITLTYGVGVALAAFAGVLAAPIYQVNPADGRRSHHRRVRRRGDRRHGLDHGLDRHRLRARRHRGPDQGVLSRGVDHRDLRDHGDRAADQAGRACSARSAEDGRRSAAVTPRSVQPGACWSASIAMAR